jgi:hypothetical protein
VAGSLAATSIPCLWWSEAVCERGRPAAMDGRRNGHGRRWVAVATRDAPAVLARQAGGCLKVISSRGGRRCASRGILAPAASGWNLGARCSVRRQPGGRHGRAAASSAVLPAVLVLHAAPSQPAAGRVGLAPSGPRHLAPGAPCPAAPAGVPATRRPGRGGAVRSPWRRVHLRLRAARRVAGHQD